MSPLVTRKATLRLLDSNLETKVPDQAKIELSRERMSLIERLNQRQELLDSKEVIKLLGVHITTLQLWTRHRRIPFIRVGHLIRFDPAQLASWLSERQTNP